MLVIEVHDVSVQTGNRTPRNTDKFSGPEATYETLAHKTNRTLLGIRSVL